MAMALSSPKLTTSDGSTYTVTCTRGHAYPWDYFQYKPNQDIEYTRDGLGMVRKNGDAKRATVITIHAETYTIAAQIYTLFTSTYVDYMMNTFRFYPNKDSGTYYNMRLTGAYEMRLIESIPNNERFDITIPCREE